MYFKGNYWNWICVVEVPLDQVRAMLLANLGAQKIIKGPLKWSIIIVELMQFITYLPIKLKFILMVKGMLLKQSMV